MTHSLIAALAAWRKHKRRDAVTHVSKVGVTCGMVLHARTDQRRASADFVVILCGSAGCCSSFRSGPQARIRNRSDPKMTKASIREEPLIALFGLHAHSTPIRLAFLAF